jgi:hypothetical protein
MNAMIPRLSGIFLSDSCLPALPLLLLCARLECLERLGDEDGIWVWKRINALFNWLPLAALIEGKILCMHGGIGRCINRIEQIAELERPITMEVRKGSTQQQGPVMGSCDFSQLLITGGARPDGPQH